MKNPNKIDTIEAERILTEFRTKISSSHQEIAPVERRIQEYLRTLLSQNSPELPNQTLRLYLPGLAKIYSLAPDANSFISPYLSSYRIRQGILHNPKSDRRTTKGAFHVAEGGLPIPDDKIAVPLSIYSGLLREALSPPSELLELPFTATRLEKNFAFVSLLMRPIVCPGLGATFPERSMETLFFAPGSLVSNLDFVEEIFGNAGDPSLPENDAALDFEKWTGHTGCVILAPHLTSLPKKALGLPERCQATPRQIRDGMFWDKPDEKYNDGNGFKVTSRDARGVMVTLIADNYYGYCKKEVKTQISFAANLFGLAEEEHAGGARAYSSAILGSDWIPGRFRSVPLGKYSEAVACLGPAMERLPGNCARDKNFEGIFFIPEDATFDLREGLIRWSADGAPKSIPIRFGEDYFLPSGYRIRAEKKTIHGIAQLVGTMPIGVLCHKPATVSGGGKSEISKRLDNAMLEKSVIVKEFEKDLDRVDEILKMDFSNIHRSPMDDPKRRRKILDTDRSVGSVVKLLTPSPEYTDGHNAWVRALPQTVREIIFSVKERHHSSWNGDWRKRFTVDLINGYPGHELKFEGRKLIARSVRVGFDVDGSWRIHKVRPDFYPADKVQVEDDITASAVFPREWLGRLSAGTDNPCLKLAVNVEARLFQRPDDAIHPGFDRQAEADLSGPGNFLSNFEPLDAPRASAIRDRILYFEDFTEPVKKLFDDFIENPRDDHVVLSAMPRLVDGKPSKNPRYLQTRPDVLNPRATYLADLGERLARGIEMRTPIFFPMNAVIAGRRNSPADRAAGLPPLAVYNPIHYQELPELFMDFISSLTGKSPSTTGFGSEGALTKGPFNALLPIIDLNNALVAYILTGYAGFTSAAGFLGPNIRIDHDVSLLIPEVWCRMSAVERDPEFLIQNGFLEKIVDFEFEGRRIPASRLGYRMTTLFADRFFGRIFETPDRVFTEAMLHPETQDARDFADGIAAIADSQQSAASGYFRDGSVERACPPLRALLHIMATGSFEGKDIHHPDIRGLFSRNAMLSSAWYAERLETKRKIDLNRLERNLRDLRAASNHGELSSFPDLQKKIESATATLTAHQNIAYTRALVGTIGADPAAIEGLT